MISGRLNMTKIRVCAALVVDDLSNPKRILACQKDYPPSESGLWEFPGGKMEPDEDAAATLARELAEELCVDVVIGAEFRNPEQDTWPISPQISMRTWFVTATSEPVLGPDHRALRWLTIDELDSVEWLPADRPVARQLQVLLLSTHKDHPDPPLVR